jgi:maintenance of morphology protein 1
LVGSRSRLQNVPKIAQLVEAKLHTWFDERCVEPRFQQIVLPSLWPRTKNTRGGEEDGSDPVSLERNVVEKNLREEARREVESEEQARLERYKAEQQGLRFGQTTRGEDYSYSIPGNMPSR